MRTLDPNGVLAQVDAAVDDDRARADELTWQGYKDRTVAAVRAALGGYEV